MWRFLQEDTENAHQFNEYLSDNYWALVLMMTTGIVVLVCGACFLREFCWSRYRIEVCPGAAGSYRRRLEREQLLEDQEVARQLQQELERQMIEAEMTRKRKERRAKYEVYLTSYSMIVRKDDFCHPCAETGEPEIGNRQETGVKQCQSKETDETMDEELDLEEQTLAERTNDTDQVLLKIPGKGGKSRFVSSSCAICLGEYEAGERIVWSSKHKCLHVFHDDCILTWLSKGKKRCPICRSFFVPGVAIDGIKSMDIEAELERSSSSLEGDHDELESSFLQNRRGERRHSSPNDDEILDEMEMGSSPSSPVADRRPGQTTIVALD